MAAISRAGSPLVGVAPRSLEQIANDFFSWIENEEENLDLIKQNLTSLYRENPQVLQARDEGETPFLKAASLLDLDLLECLYSLNPEVIQDQKEEGVTAFLMSCICYDQELEKPENLEQKLELISCIYKLDPSVLDQVNEQSENAFFLASVQGSYQIVNHLWSLNKEKAKELIAVKNRQGFTAFEVAAVSYLNAPEAKKENFVKVLQMLHQISEADIHDDQVVPESKRAKIE